MAILSNDVKLNGYKIHGTDEAIPSGILHDKDYIGMSNNSAVSYDIRSFSAGVCSRATRTACTIASTCSEIATLISSLVITIV